MKEKIKKYKLIILFWGFILLNIGSMIYQNRMSEEKIYLSEPIKEEEEQQDNLLNLEGQMTLVEEGLSTIEPIEKHLEKGITSSVENGIEEEITHEVPVYICGEVKKPGVYYVHSEAIINDIVVISGGFTDEANSLAINLASPIKPNEKIIIPKQGEEIDKLMDSYDNIERAMIDPYKEVDVNEQDNRVHINTASKEEFMTLNGIGEVKAEAIIAYRQEKGGFNSIEEVKNISGIGEKTFEKIKPFITIE